MRAKNNQTHPTPKDQPNPSHTEENSKPLVTSNEKNIVPPVVDKLLNKPRKIHDDPYGDSSDDEPSPEMSEDDSSGTEDEGQGSNRVKGPVLNEHKNASHEDDDERKAKRKLFI